MPVTGAFKGFFNEMAAAGRNSGVYKYMSDPKSGASLFQSTLGKIRGIRSNAAFHAVNSAGLPALASGISGRTIMGSYFRNHGGAMAINAGVGAAYGGMTDQNGPIHGMVGGAVMGAAAGGIGRAGLIGARKGMRFSREFDMGQGTKLAINPTWGAAKGLYRKATSRAARMKYGTY